MFLFRYNVIFFLIFSFFFQKFLVEHMKCCGLRPKDFNDNVRQAKVFNEVIVVLLSLRTKQNVSVVTPFGVERLYPDKDDDIMFAYFGGKDFCRLIHQEGRHQGGM